MRSSNLSHMPNRTGHVDRCGDGGGGDGNEHRRQKKDEPMDHVSGFPGFVLFEARYTIWNRIATRAMSLTLLLRRKRSGSVLCIESRNRTVSCSEAVCHSHKGHDIRGISWPVECLRRGLFPIMLEQTEAAHDRVERSRCRGDRDRRASEEDLVPRGAGCHTSRRCGGWDRANSVRNTAVAPIVFPMRPGRIDGTPRELDMRVPVGVFRTPRPPAPVRGTGVPFRD